jgi:polysaccharide biosynthesis protein VpsM
MQNNRFFVAALVAAGLSAPLMGALTLGDGSELFLNGTVGFQYDDNLFLRNTNAKGDYITTLTPGVEVQFGQNSLAKGSFIYNEAFTRYNSHSSQDSNLASVAFNTNYDDGKTKASFGASYNQVAQNTVDARLAAILVRRDITAVNGRGEWSLSDKTSFAAGANYNRTNYKTAGFVTSSDYSIPLDFYYEMMPKVDMSVEYKFRETDLSQNQPKYTDNFLGVGARGEFSPKLSGEYHIGYTQRHLGSGGSNESLLGVDSNFIYLFSPKTTVNLGVSNDFDNAATGVSQKVLSGTLGVQTQFEEGFSGNVAVSYRDLNYNSGERDHYWETTVGLQQQYNKYLSFTAAYTYRNNSSNLPVGFADNVFSVSGSVRY